MMKGARMQDETARLGASPGPRETMVKVEDVTKDFGTVVAVERVNFALESGKFLTILGPSGCGKTTLLRMIAGFLDPTEGEIYLHGQRVSSVPPYKRSIGMVFQRLALFPHMTAAENVAYPLRMRRFDPRKIPDLVTEYLALVSLDGLGRRRIHELSGGQQQRVAIARSLVFKPDLLLLDEPLSSLDKKLREEMQVEFRRIQQELGVTTINVTHDQREALVMSDDIVVMDHGCIQQDAHPIELYRQPSNPFVAGFIGVTNFFAATVSAAGDAEATVNVGEAELRGRHAGETLGAGDTVDCAIRAEQIRIFSDPEERDDLDSKVRGVVNDVIFEGDRLVYEVTSSELGGAVLRVFDHDPLLHKAFDRGAVVLLGWNTRDLLIFARA
jgi:putative spermidine/putrescine transport system ATP-binding protein